MSSTFYLLSPELALVIGLIAGIVVDLIVNQREALHVQVITIAASLGALSMTIWQLAERSMQGSSSMEGLLFQQTYSIDFMSLLMKALILFATVLILLLTASRPAQGSTRAEQFYLMLPASLGAIVMASAADLITMYVGLELLSLSSYILIALRPHHERSKEAAFKAIVIGSISSATALFGMSYIYGIAGSTNIATINNTLEINSIDQAPLLLFIGFVLFGIGMLTKLAAAPFHYWAPDVYQGAPLPVTALLSTVSKIGALAALFRISYNFVIGTNSSVLAIKDMYFLLIHIVVIATLIVATVQAFRQLNVMRLLALSGVINTGYFLIPLTQPFDEFNSSQLANLYFYLTVYVVMTIGMFTVISILSKTDENDQIDIFRGLYTRSPRLAGVTTLFLLSLAGLPISAAFFGKLFLVLGSAMQDQYFVIGAVVCSTAITYFIYFRILRLIYLREPIDEQPPAMNNAQRVIITLTALLVLVGGIYPSPFMNWIQSNYSIVQHLFFN